MTEEYRPKAAAIPRDAATDETGVTIAFVRYDIEEEDVCVHWLPELFASPLPPAVKALIVEKLRFHAEMLESGEMEERMKKFAAINSPQNRTESVQ